MCVYAVSITLYIVPVDSGEFPSLSWSSLEELLQQQGLHVDTRDEVVVEIILE